MTTIVLAPGQGSQTAGFLTPWITDVPGFRSQLEAYSEVVDLDLIELGTEAAEETIKDTAIAQPLIVAASLASYRTMPATNIVGVAGHSVGEFTAAAISGVLSDQDALKMVSVRAKAMAKASAMTATGMAAIIGGEPIEVDAKLEDFSLVGANHNGAGQLVAAGLRTDIQRLLADPPEKARVIELRVAGAFHTSFMEDARLELETYSTQIVPDDPQIQLWSNESGQLVETGQEFLRLLVHQVANPVRWDLVMGNLVGLDAQIVELVPAGALSGLVKRAVQDCRALPLRSPQDFEKVAE